MISPKVIKCPQCGSTQQVLLSMGHYKCRNCATEYLVDTSVKNSPPPPPYFPPPPGRMRNMNKESRPPVSSKKSSWGCLWFFIFIVVLIGILGYLGNRNTKEDKHVDSTIEHTFPLVDKNNNPHIFILERVSDYSNGYDNEYYFSFYDIDNGKHTNETYLVRLESDLSEIRNQGNDNEYLLIGNKNVFSVDNDLLDVREVTSELFLNTLGNNYYSIFFVNPREGMGFNYHGIGGNADCYFPLVDKTYLSSSQMESKSKGMKTLLSGAKDSLYYVSSTIRNKGKEEQILYKINYKWNAGGPEYKYEGGRPISNKDEYRITDYKNLYTPMLDKDVFVLYYDFFRLLIVSRDEKGTNMLLSLDNKNGKVIWSYQLEEFTFNDKYSRVCYYNNKYIIGLNQTRYVILTEDGDLIKSFDILSVKSNKK